MRLGTLLAVFGLLVAACGGGEVAETQATQAVETSQSTSADPAQGGAATASTAVPSTVVATTSTVAAEPGIAALTSGRGDDGSLEVGIWFGSDPFAAGIVDLKVGTDADDSYPGVGDPIPHIDAWAEVSAEGVRLLDKGEVVASDTGGGLNDWLSWTGPGETVWFYFIGNVPVRAGSVWVVVEVNGSTPVGGAAGAPVGSGCSYHGAGVELGAVRGDVPQPGEACRYP